MKKVLVDTIIIIDYLRCESKEKSYFFKIFSRPNYQAFVTLTTITELWAGKSMGSKKTFKTVSELVKNCTVIIPNIKTAKLAGEILRETNYEISFQDASIGAIALENNLPILSLDNKDFKKIKGIKFFKL